MKCPVCGTQNMADSVTCVKCGSALPVADQPQASEPQGDKANEEAAKNNQTVQPKPERTSVSKVFIAWFLFNAFGSASSAFNILKDFGDLGPVTLLGAVISIVNCVACVLLVIQKKMMWFYVFAVTIILNFFYVVLSDGVDMTFTLIMVAVVAIELGISFFLVKRNKAYLS